MYHDVTHADPANTLLRPQPAERRHARQLLQPAHRYRCRRGTVTWTNSGSNPHTSTGQNNLWNSGTLNPGQTFSRQFPQAGAFPYVCTIHAGMSGTVVVQ